MTRLLLPNPLHLRRLHRSFSTQFHGSPPSPSSSPSPLTNHNKHDITDEEWEIRTGRAIYILRETLPDFFAAGLVANSEGVDNMETIYSSRIRLMYTPPVALPAPFPRTLHVEGLPLYMASAVFVRHTLNALYADPHVELRKFTVNTPRDVSGSQKSLKDGKGREKNLFIGLSVSGTARVSGGRGEWDINSTYTFSPLTGLIDTHTVNSIHPAPHQAVWDAVRTGLGKVLGLGGTAGGGLASEGRGAGTMCGEGKRG